MSSEHNCAGKQHLSIWYCEACRSVHFRAGEILLTFSPGEFIEFAAAVGDLYGQAYFELVKERADRDYPEFGLVS